MKASRPANSLSSKGGNSRAAMPLPPAIRPVSACGKADQRATDERCERRLLQSGVVRLTSAGTGRTVNCPLILPLKLNTRANRIFQPFS